MDMYGQWNQQYAAPMDPATQMYWQQYYSAYGAANPYYGYGAPPVNMTPGAPIMPPGDATVAGSLPSTTGVNPLPPADPPKEPPPLPAEPPPEERKTTPTPEEHHKLSALQMQAAQWQQQKQWEEYQQSLVQYQQQLQQWNAQQASLLEQVSKEEAEFETQYSDWLKQYTDWKEQNKNHPNKEQYQQYEKQWKQYEEQMAQKREFIQQRKRSLVQTQQPSHLTAPVAPPDYLSASAATIPVSTVTAAPVAAPAPVVPPPVVHAPAVPPPAAVPAPLPVVTPTATVFPPSTTPLSVPSSYPSNVYGGMAAHGPPPHFDYSSAGMHGQYPGMPSYAGPPPGYGAPPVPNPGRFPPPGMPGYSPGYGYPGVAPSADPGFGIRGSRPDVSMPVTSAEAASHPPNQTRFGHPPNFVPTTAPAPVASLATTTSTVPGIQASVSSGDMHVPVPPYGGVASGSFRPGFASSNAVRPESQRPPAPRPAGMENRFNRPPMGVGQRPGFSGAAVRPFGGPPPHESSELAEESFNSGVMEGEEGDWNQFGGFGDGPRKPAPRFGGNMGPRMLGPRPGMGTFNPRGVEQSAGPRSGIMRGPRPLMGQQQMNQLQEECEDYDSSNFEDNSYGNETRGDIAKQMNISSGVGQQGPRFQAPGSRPMDVAIRGVRPGFGDNLSGPRPRMGFGEPGAQLRFPRFPGPRLTEEPPSDDVEFNENAEQLAENEEQFYEEEGDESVDYAQEGAFGMGKPRFGNPEMGYNARFGAAGVRGPPPGPGGFPRGPRMDIRAAGPRFGPRGFGGPPRGPQPVSLLSLVVRPPSGKPPLESMPDQEVEDYGENEEQLLEETAQDEMPMPAGFGIKPLRPGLRGFMGDQRPREPGGFLQPRGPRMLDARGQQRFPGPGGLGPRVQQPPFPSQRIPRPRLDEPRFGPRFGGPRAGDHATGFPRGPFPRIPSMIRPPRFGEPLEARYVEGEDFGYDENAENFEESMEYGEMQADYGQEGTEEEQEQWQQHDPAFAAGDSDRGGFHSKREESNLAAAKQLKFSEHQHELIKKATEELMQKKLPPLGNILSNAAPTTSSVTPGINTRPMPSGGTGATAASSMQGKDPGSADGNRREFNRQFSEYQGDQEEQHGEEYGYNAEQEQKGFGQRFMGARPGPPDGRRDMLPGGRLEDRPFPDERGRGRGFPPSREQFPSDRKVPGLFDNELPFPPRDRPFPDSGRFADPGMAGRDTRPTGRDEMPEGRKDNIRGKHQQGDEFEQRRPPWAGRFEEEPGFRGPQHGDKREFHGPRDEPFFGGPKEEGQFRGPPDDFGFRGRPEGFSRRPFVDAEQEQFRPPFERDIEPLLPWNRFDREGRPPRPPGGPRDLFEEGDLTIRPPAPFGVRRDRPPPSLMDLPGLRPPEATTVIDYGHGVPDARGRGDDRHMRIMDRENTGRWEEERDMRMEREFGRQPPMLDGRRLEGRPPGGPPFRDDVGPLRRRSRSPPFRRDMEQAGDERGNFDRMMHDRAGRDRRDADRLPFGVRAVPGLDVDRSRLRDLGSDNRQRDMDRDRQRVETLRGNEPPSRNAPGQQPPSGLGPPRFGGPPRMMTPQQHPPRPLMEEIRVETVMVDDLLVMPGRQSRPDHIVVIIRGPPGAGKTYVSKLLKDKEMANGGTQPRTLCLDDYFTVEVEKTITEPETGRKVKKLVMEYEYDSAMEPSYRTSFVKNFRRQIDDCYFNFIIVDAVFDKAAHLEEFWSYAKSKGFQVYIAEVQTDVQTCTKRNTHQRSQADIQKIIDGWEETPKHYIRLDIRSLLQEAAIENVEMEDTSAVEDSSKTQEKKDEEEEEVEGEVGIVKSKWELDTSEQRLDKLDGLRQNKAKKGGPTPQRLEDYLQLPDDYESRTTQPGKKRVRWADIEERKDQLRRRELGFVVGQTDWAKMTDDTYAERALNRTTYF